MIKSILAKKINFLFDLKNTEIIVLGNQKSGTTAITKLLGLNTRKNNLIDSPLLWEPNLSKIANGNISLKNTITKNKFYFARSIIKEPNLTFFYHDLISFYPPSVKFIYTV